MNMLKKVLLIVAAIIMLQNVCFSFGALPEEQYCSTSDGYDYYVTGILKPHNPGLYYADVRKSDGTEYRYTFSYNPPNNTYSYHYTYRTSSKNVLGSGFVNENQLANDILYVTMQLVENR